MSLTQSRRSQPRNRRGLQITLNALAQLQISLRPQLPPSKEADHQGRLTDLGMTNFRNWRIRVLLYAGKPDWTLLPTVTP